MQTQNGSFAKWYAALAALLGWFAIMAQFYLILTNRTTPLPETITRFFSYFTVLTNIIVAICFTAIFMSGKGNLTRFFLRTDTQTAITVYIIMVGAVYNLILRFIWSPQGLQKLVDELLHSVIPLLFILYWLIFVRKSTLQYKDAFRWLLYPLCYTVFIAIRGAISGFYPYPFVNVSEIGFPRALLNGGILVLVFTGLSLFLIAIPKWLIRK